MKVLPFKIPKPEQSALIYQVDQGIAFYPHLHQHEEIQYSVILKGEGDIFVGDTIGRYAEGDVFIIGSNLPHLFRSEEGATEQSHMLTVFFTRDSFGENFFDMPDLQELSKVMKKIDIGVRLKENKDKIKDKMMRVESAGKLERFVLLMELLKIASESESENLSSFINQKGYTEDEGSRMDKVMHLAFTDFQRNISLDEVADRASMTRNAFCRYFKQRTRKTFFQFLSEIRVEHAARLLIKNPSLSISEISDMSGFRNLSNFNRQFKSLKSETPTNYRRKNLGKIK